MDTQQVGGTGSATVFDLQSRRRDDAGSAVSVRLHRSSRWSILELVGEVDIDALSVVTDLVGNDLRRVVFELHGVTFMDATGLAMMVDLQRRALAAGGCVRLAAPSSSVRRVLRLTGCRRTFQTFDSVLQAISTPVGAEPRPAS